MSSVILNYGHTKLNDYQGLLPEEYISVCVCVFYMFKVCLDHTATTEKELDTVEVLKAIQKAKEAKDRMASMDKKVRGCTHATCFCAGCCSLS